MNYNLPDSTFDRDTFTNIVKLGLSTPRALNETEEIKLGEALKKVETRSLIYRIFDTLGSITHGGYISTIESRIGRFREFLNTPEGKDFVKNAIEIAAQNKIIPPLPSNFELKNAVNILLIPEGLTPTEADQQKQLIQKKQVFFDEHLPQDPSAAFHLFQQCRTHPFLGQMLKELEQGYAKWDLKTKPEDLESVIFIHHNLIALSQIYDELLLENPENKDLFKQQYNPELQSILEPYIKGDELIESKIVDQIKEKIQQTLPEVEYGPREKVVRPDAPLVKGTAELFGASRKAQSFAATREKLVPLGTSANAVFEMKEPSGLRSAFYKEGAEGKQAGSVMEELMWQMAGIMGDADHFVATKQTRLHLAAKPGEEGEKVNLYVPVREEVNAKGEVEGVSDITETQLSSSRKGSIQAAQGVPLADFFNQAAIPQEEVDLAGFMDVVYGTGDEHLGNVLVSKVTDEEGKTTLKIKHFDNTRNMTHSNGYISYGPGVILSSMRVGVLTLPQSKVPFSEERRQVFRDKLAQYQNKIGELESYLKSDSVKKKLDQLPAGWLDIEDALSAQKERLERLEKAVNNPKVSNLRELIFAVNPEFKLFAALELASLKAEGRDITQEDEQTFALGVVGFHDLGSLLTVKYDLKAIKAICDNPNLSFEEMAAAINALNLISDPEAVIENFKFGQNLMKDAVSRAKLDLKDMDKNNIQKCIEYIYETFKTFDVAMTSQLEKAIEKVNEGAPFAIRMPRREDIGYRGFSINICYKNNKNEMIYASLDYKTRPGKVGIDGLFVTPYAIIEAFNTRSDSSPATELQHKLGIK